jgi:hypothetical protein
MTILDDYARAGDPGRTGSRRPRATSYVSDFDAWPETTPAATSALRDRATNKGSTIRGPARDSMPDAGRERSFA